MTVEYSGPIARIVRATLKPRIEMTFGASARLRGRVRGSGRARGHSLGWIAIASYDTNIVILTPWGYVHFARRGNTDYEY